MTVPATIVQAAKDNISRLLDETFHGTLTFDPITVEPTVDFYGEENLEIIVVYDGDDSLLDPHALNTISTELGDILYGLGFNNFPLESYIAKDEYPEWFRMSNSERPWEYD